MRSYLVIYTRREDDINHQFVTVDACDVPSAITAANAHLAVAWPPYLREQFYISAVAPAGVSESALITAVSQLEGQRS